MEFKDVCPQYVKINADYWDFLDTPLACPICGKSVDSEELCEHVLWFGNSQIMRLGPSTGIFENADEIEPMLTASKIKEAIEEANDEVLKFYRSLSKSCVVFCYEHIENTHGGEMKVCDMLAVRFSKPPFQEVETVGDWIDSIAK